MKAKKKIEKTVTWPYFAAMTAALVYIACEIYGPALHGPFVYDDFSLPYYNPLFQSKELLVWISGVRPLLLFSYWANFHFSGRNTFSYHVVNLLLHLANSGAVYLIARRILAREITDVPRREIIAAFAGTLFLLHPLQTESVAWIAGRSESLSAFFFLWAFAIFVYRPAGAIGWLRSIAVLLLFACAVASKEHTATLPIILLLTDLWMNPERPIVAVRRDWKLYGPLLAGMLVAGVFILRIVTGSHSAGFAGTGIGSLSYALTQCRVFWIYLRLFVLPFGQNIDYDMAWSPAYPQFLTVAGFLGVVALAVLAWRLRRRFPVGSYGFLLFLILLAPTSSVIPIKDPIAERRLYLPMLGLVLVAAEFLYHAIRQRASILAFAGVVLLAASALSYQRNRLWGSEAALWEDTVAKSPNKLRGYGHLVHGLVEERRCREALQRLDEMSQRMAPDPALLGHWAIAYECVHEPAAALAKLELLAAQAPGALTYVDIARNQVALGRDQDALDSLNRALKMDPSLEMAYLMRAEVYEGVGDVSRATSDYRTALQLNPANEQAQWRLQRVVGYTLHR